MYFHFILVLICNLFLSLSLSLSPFLSHDIIPTHTPLFSPYACLPLYLSVCLSLVCVCVCVCVCVSLSLSLSLSHTSNVSFSPSPFIILNIQLYPHLFIFNNLFLRNFVEFYLDKMHHSTSLSTIPLVEYLNIFKYTFPRFLCVLQFSVTAMQGVVYWICYVYVYATQLWWFGLNSCQFLYFCFLSEIMLNRSSHLRGTW